MTDSDSTPTKTCAKCGECKPATQEFFYRSAKRLSGFQSPCKICTAALKRAKGLSKNANYHERRKAAHALVQCGMRACSVCQETKSLSFFNKHPNTVGGVAARCKDCTKAAKIKREQELHPEVVSARIEKRALAADGLKKCRKCLDTKSATTDHFYFNQGIAQTICIACRKKEESIRRVLQPEHFRAKLKEWYVKNKDYVSEKNKIYRENNRDQLNAASKAYYRKDPKRFIAYSLRWRTERRQSDPVFAMQERVRSFVGYAFRENGYTKRSKTQSILGCDWNSFKLHLERQFVKGMSWDNRSAWHVDHIVPLATAKTEEDVIALNHFTNLRPMWAKENMSKGAQITHLI